MFAYIEVFRGVHIYIYVCIDTTALSCNTLLYMSVIRECGIYYTTLFNPFALQPFREWMAGHRIEKETILEPFAGCNSIINMLQSIGFANRYKSYDIYPQSPEVNRRNTIDNYPHGYTVCITNPPWLYKSSAHRRGLAFPVTDYDDLYKLCLDKSLQYNEYIGALIPASFIQSGLFTQRLEKVIFLNRPLFRETSSPVCLALFGKTGPHIRIYNDNQYIGSYSQLKSHLPPKSNNTEINFNIPTGQLGFIAIDNNKEPSIKFCHGQQLRNYAIRDSSRSITRIGGICVTEQLIGILNDCVAHIRENTKDIFLTTFKGLRKDGKYRRRMEYKLARDIINYAR